MAGPRTWPEPAAAIAQGPLGHRCSHRARLCGRVHLKPAGRQPGAARPADANPSRAAEQPIGSVTADGTYDTRKCLSAIIEWGATAIIPIRKNGRLWKEVSPAARSGNETPSLTSFETGPLEALDRLPRPKLGRGEDAVPQELRRPPHGQGPRLPSRRVPHLHHSHEPLHEPLLGRGPARDRARHLSLRGKGESWVSVRVTQQRPSAHKTTKGKSASCAIEMSIL